MKTYERTPQELRELRQWHCWADRNGTKVPVQTDGSPAKSNDSSTWTDFETAVDAAAFHSGLAFEITPPYVGIDLDGCIDEDGDLRQWAWEIVARFDGIGFFEVSPSGTGIKIITRAEKPVGMGCVAKITTNKQQIEVYAKTRFWTITGDVYGSNTEIGDGQEALNWLFETHFRKQPQAPKPAKPVEPRAMPLNGVDNLLKRADKYMKSIPPAGEGGRNLALFSLAGHLNALVGERGERLTQEQITDLCCEWNQTLASPLSDDEIQRTVNSAGRNGTPREDKPPTPFPMDHEYPHVDISALIGTRKTEDEDDENWCLQMVPPAGLMREVFEYYCQTSHRRSNVMGLAVALTLCQTLFGRRVRSHTDIRTNDYNVVIAPTASGKEACETTITRILYQADASKVPLLPPDVQSGNGLLKAVSLHPRGLWICDEFGKVLEAILDRKSNNGHAKQIGTHLLKLYSKASGIYGGAAHAEGARNEIIQPHLCLLGLTTGQIFETIDSRQIQDGLFGRIAFWPVADRPKRQTGSICHAPESLAETVRQWMGWEPVNLLNQAYPKPKTVEMSSEALQRWERHADAIDERMEGESESRAAIWGRVAARAMKLGLCHRAARLQIDPSVCDWSSVRIERIDIEWGIKLANWLARIACGLVRENVVDRQHERAKAVLLSVAEQSPDGVSHRDLSRAYRSISRSEFTAAAKDLEANKRIEILQESSGGRPKVIYRITKT